MTTFFLNRLAAEPHALAFAGQSTPWPVALADQTTDPSLDEALRGHVAAAGRLLTPVAADLLATTGRPVDLASPRTRHASAPQPTPPRPWKAWR